MSRTRRNVPHYVENVEQWERGLIKIHVRNEKPGKGYLGEDIWNRKSKARFKKKRSRRMRRTYHIRY